MNSKYFDSKVKEFLMKMDEPPFSKIVSHSNYMDYLVELCDKPNKRVLEVGSRVVTGAKFRNRFKNAEYVGFDIYAGENVDVVGDAHKLSSYFDPGTKFDLIFSTAVFEHLAMPWIVAEEIVKMLNVGGVVFVETHYSYSAHERPWHFFQFSDMALKVLFSEEMGIKTIEAGVSNPIDGIFSQRADEYLRGKDVPYLYCHSEFLGKKTHDVKDFSWNNVNLDKLVNKTKYPLHRFRKAAGKIKYPLHRFRKLLKNNF